MHTISLVFPQTIVFFFLGICIGSFINVIIYRLPKGGGILGRSYCDNCKRKLNWYELIPILSFVFLKGRCKNCKKRIDPLLPIVELSTGLLFMTVFLKFPVFNTTSVINLIIILFVISSFISILFIDSKSGIIPNKILYPAILLTFVYVFLDGKIVENLISGLLSFGFFLIIFLATRGRGMGFGDVKLSFLLGLFLGFPIIVFGLYLAFLTGGIYSLILILWGKKKFRGDSIAFGPFLILGAILSFFLGNLWVSLLSSFL